MTPLHAVLAGLAAPLVLALATWVASVVQHDVSLVDRVWSLMIAAAALAMAWALGALPPQGDGGTRLVAMGVVLAVWALRLAAYVSARNWGHGEDRRYQAIRARNQPHFAVKSIVLIFTLQAVLAWLVALPFAAAAAGTRPFGLLDAIGIALAAVGTVYEIVADAQMAAFKRDPANKGLVMDRGLWRSSRHPNYFGEFCVWWGFWLAAVAAGAGIWSWAAILSPTLMTVLLLKVSGVSLLEKDIGDRRPAYAGYIASTNAFFPGPRRR